MIQSFKIHFLKGIETVATGLRLALLIGLFVSLLVCLFFCLYRPTACRCLDIF